MRVAAKNRRSRLIIATQRRKEHPEEAEEKSGLCATHHLPAASSLSHGAGER